MTTKKRASKPVESKQELPDQSPIEEAPVADLLDKDAAVPSDKKSLKDWANGKKTYAAIASAIVTWGCAVAIKHGYDLGPLSADLVEVLTFVFLALAAKARSMTGK